MPIPPSDNYYSDNDDLRWHLNNSIDWEGLVKLYERDYTLEGGPDSLAEAKEFYIEILDQIGAFVANEIAPRATALDAKGNKLVDGEVVPPSEMEEIFSQLGEMGMFGLTLPREFGGLNVPFALYFALCEVFSRADCGTMTHFGFFGGIGMSLLVYSAKEGSLEMKDGVVTSCRFQSEIEECAAGENWGAMVLTEPDAGSDLSALRARAVKQADGTYRLNGEKIFITSGHGQYQIVIARTDDPQNEVGLDGLSLFLVRRWLEVDGERVENVKVTKVEKKLGHNSSATVSLLYEDSVAELIGKEGEGFQLMLILMNNARVAVGFEAIGVCQQAYRSAVHYASQRRSMGKFLKDHELMADILQTMDTELRGMRALAFETVNHVEYSQRLETKLKFDPPSDAGERREMQRKLKRAKRKARGLTPLLKYIAAEKAVEFARTNMQVHGGMGYISETGADRLLRDALVLPVYEGTSQIQALMAMKDHLGAVIKDPAGFLERALRLRVAAQTARGLERALLQAKVKLHQATETILRRILAAKLKSEIGQRTFVERLGILTGDFMRSWDAKRDFAHGLVHADRICRMLCDVKIAEALVHQAEKHPERTIYAERYLKRMLPRVTCLELEIQGSVDLDDLTRTMAQEEAAV